MFVQPRGLLPIRASNPSLLPNIGRLLRMLSFETLVLIPRRPLAWREFLLQSWFVARVSIVPTIMLSIPFTVLLVFTFNVLLVDLGAADFSGELSSLEPRRAAARASTPSESCS